MKSQSIIDPDDLAAAREEVSRQENDLEHLKAFSQLLTHLATCPNSIESEVMLMLGDAHDTLIHRISARWDRANNILFDLGRPHAREAK